MSTEEVRQIKNTGLVRSVFSLSRKPKGPGELDSWLRYRAQRLVRDLSPKRSLGNFVTVYNQETFNKILKKNTYDYIVISYVHWANFIRDNRYTGNAKLIIDTHDFMTAQETVWKHFNIGHAFADEMKRVNFFDEIWTISVEEQYLFRQFTEKEVVHIPYATTDHTVEDQPDKKYDLLYVASDNRHNIKAAEWFFKEVYPRLDPSLRICVIGGIHKHVQDHPAIEKIPYADDLTPYYLQARVAICPMLTGTGVKIKVIEALSYGLPVVCTPKGVDGLLNKTGNGCVVANSGTAFGNAINKLLSDSVYYDEMKEDGARFFQKNHSRQHFLKILSRKFTDIKGYE